MGMSRQFSANRLRASTSFVRLTGVSVTTSDEMPKQLVSPWDKAQRGKAKPGRPSDVGCREDQLLTMLIYYRCYITHEFLGFFCDINRSVIRRAILRVEKFARPLIGVAHKPKVSRKEAEALIIDCTEEPIQRPGTEAKHRELYTGKKNQHTMKDEYIVTRDGRIVSASPPRPGSHRDLTIRVDGPRQRKKARPHVGSVYHGYEMEHRNLEFPCKRPKNGKLTNVEKGYNRGLSGFRVSAVAVPHCFQPPCHDLLAS
jgi:hypothetical protein